MAADIAQTGRTQQGIGNRMQKRISIRMTQQAFFKRNVDAAEYQISTFDQLMDIVALSDTDIHVCFLK
ncbi:Uncharacterised protein [Mycobacteroides abscessus subsp. massiliense]|nr:Uncharacterised protein [Mycobacteroides abscessus subsp. massiliense]